MNLVDANVLLYAVNESDPKHEVSRRWLDGALNGRDPVAFAWLAVLAFVRLSTRAGLFPAPLSAADAMQRVEDWLGQAPAVVLDPTTRHLAVLSGLLRAVGTGGNLVGDAHLAAIAVEHGATIVTFDSDFGRFPGVSWTMPATT
ncbi:MAG: type II toxin-antitoxin system VapC family toxin [Acidimicrobiia bacterium]